MIDPEVVERIIAGGRDTAEARMAAGSARLKRGELDQATAHLARAVAMRPDYAAAWQALGTARRSAGDADGARTAWTRGVQAARDNGDKQAEKVMAVFLRRLEKEDTG